MATITKSIGTSSRDYSTITAWEADLDNTGIYTSGDDAVGECYNDTAFDEGVFIDGGATVGLNSIKLTAANGEKHDGTEGTGVRIVSSTQTIFIGTGGSVDKTISFIEVDRTASANANFTMISLSGSAGSGATNNLNACIVHGAAVSTQNYRSLKGIATGSVAGITHNITNNIVYDITHASGGNPAGITTATGNIYIYNCTVHDITEPGGTTGSCFSVTCNDLRNCIATDCSGNDFAIGTISGTESNNLSSDATASGTGSLTNKTAANQFVSTVAGSEDLHLKINADAIDAGVDLGTTPAGVQYDIDGRDRDAAGDTWDIGADEFVRTTPATITKSIGTSSRDYSTITAWEADLDNTGVYISGDDAVGECYNDTAFDEDATINGGNTVGLNSVTLKVADGERHDGTEGTGARLVYSGSSTGNILNIGLIYNTRLFQLLWLEVDNNGNANPYIAISQSGNSLIVKNVIVHGMNKNTSGTTAGIGVVGGFSGEGVFNSIVYDCNKIGNTSSGESVGISFGGNALNHQSFNNTVYGITSTYNAYGIRIVNDNNSSKITKNNIAVGTSSSSSSTADDFYPAAPTTSVMQYNLSSDSTASGTGSLTGKTAANQFVSTVAGSEDLHLLPTADAVGAGEDLATTSIDINGSDRNALAATVWDIGAHQYASTASIGTSSRDYSTITAWEADLDDTAIYGAGANAVGECYNDSTFTANAYMDGGGTVGLNSVKLTAAAGNGHDGTAGTGAKFVSQAWYQTLSGGDNVRVTVSLLEIDYNSQRIGSLSGRGAGTGFGNTYNRLLLYNGDMHQSVFYYDYASMDISNNIVYNMSGSRGQYVVRTTSSATSYITNNTAYNIQGGYGISNGYYLRFGSTICKNCIAIDVIGDCFVYSGSPVAEYNISSDGTATGTGSQTNKSAANQFVSTLSGSEDLHIVETSDAFGAGVDLGTVVDGVQYDIDGTNRDAFTGTTWDIGADQVYITASIGTSSRDYSTITAWEADLDDTSLYTSGDDAVGECYNDSTFTGGANINGGTTVGLSSVTLSVAEGERHDGTLNTGVKIKPTYIIAGQLVSISRDNLIVEWLECEVNGTSTYAHTPAIAFNIYYSNNSARYLVLKGENKVYPAQTPYLAVVGGNNNILHNNIVYGTANGNNGGGIADSYRAYSAFNNTIYDCNYGYKATSSDQNQHTIKNNLSIGNNVDFYPSTVTVGSSSNNASSDSTATAFGGSNHVTGAPVSRQFVSTLSGSEDLHLIFKSAAIDAGVDLGTTPDGVQYDINGKDRDTENSIWDIGAHEYGDNVIFGLLRV